MDDGAAAALREAFSGRELLLIAPGKSAVSARTRIGAHIAGHDPIVIGVNAMVSDYAYDYVFFVNPARYEYAKTTAPERFRGTRRIVLSNIKTQPEDGEWIVSFDHAAKRGWPHFDNAVICCLRMLDWLGVERVTLAGFDGFKQVYNESYADPLLPSLKTDGSRDALNDEIRDMFQSFKRDAAACRNIEMLTESYFEQA